MDVRVFGGQKIDRVVSSLEAVVGFLLQFRLWMWIDYDVEN